MAYCPHGNLAATCSQCRSDAVRDAERRAALNRARGESKVIGRIDGTELPYAWQRQSLDAWVAGGKTGLVALSLGLPVGDLPFAAMAEIINGNPTMNVLLVGSPSETPTLRSELESRFGLKPSTLLDHHFLEPRDDGTLVVADIQELETVPLASWGRFASTGLLVLLEADSVQSALGEMLREVPFRYRLSVSRLPSAIDLTATRPWARAFGPLLYRCTEEQARDLGVLPRIQYRLHVETLKPEPDGRRFGPEGPWEASDIPQTMRVAEAGPFVRSRARDVATRRSAATPGLVVLHEGVTVPGSAATLKLAELPDKHAEPPSGWLLATPQADARAILRLATVAFRTLGKPGLIEDAVVLPVAADLCRMPPWGDKWRLAAIQMDRVVAGLLLAEKPGEAMTAEDLESLVGAALALRGIPADDLHSLTPIVAEAAHAAHAGESIKPERVRQAARAVGGLAASLLVAAELGPLHLLRLAHPRFTPVTPDLPHPSLYDARRHAWRGRAFAALANAAKTDLVTAWGRYPELRFVFPSSALLEAATAYCAKHKLKGPLDDAKLKKILDKTRIPTGGRTEAVAVLSEWNSALGLAEEHEREFLADMHARQPERERRREGVALPDLHVVEKSGDGMTLEANDGRLPPTNMAPGSEVALVEAGRREELARGLVSRITSRRVILEFPAGAPRHHLPRNLTLNLIFDAKVFEAYHSAVAGAVRAMGATTPVDDGPDGLLRAALLGETEPPAELAQSLEGEELTPTQRDAINGVLSGGRVRLVLGPPGTGKTHTLVHLAMALAKAGHSVLVTADSNAAVDNLVVGLRRSGFLAVRVGHAPNLRDENAQAARIDPLDAPLFVRWAAEQGIVVATTNYGAFRYIDPKGGLSPFIFDYVIHDEAGQATAPSSLAAVLRGRRLVLAGDPKQLPPTVVSMDAKEAGLDVTLFERIEELTGKGRTRMLETQFRMREPIVAFSNARYYEGRLQTHASAALQEGLPGLPAAAFQHVTGRENERARNGSISNDFEVDAVAQLVQRFGNELRERGWTLAVLTPYQAQREAIRRRLPTVEVSTVDGAQGREWDVVLYSTVRSNPQHRLGFVEDERRLNVAVTRAKRNFILVGDERTLADNPAFEALGATLEKVRLLELRREEGRAPQNGSRDRHPRGGVWQGRRERSEHRGRSGQEREARRQQDQQRQAPRPTPQAPSQPREKPDPKIIDLVDPFTAPRRSREAFVIPGGAPSSAAPPPPSQPEPAPAPSRRKVPSGQATLPLTSPPPAAPTAEETPAPKRAKAAKSKSKVAKADPQPVKAKAAKAEPKPRAAAKPAKKSKPTPDGRCHATTKTGEPCKSPAKAESFHCARHQ